MTGATASAIQEGADAASRAASGQENFPNIKTSGLNVLKGTLLGAATGGGIHLNVAVTKMVKFFRDMTNKVADDFCSVIKPGEVKTPDLNLSNEDEDKNKNQ